MSEFIQSWLLAAGDVLVGCIALGIVLIPMLGVLLWMEHREEKRHAAKSRPYDWNLADDFKREWKVIKRGRAA